MSRGFTLVELVICVAIFIFMTALVVAKYGNFNQSTLLTDTAYDIALVLHTAQSYGLSVKNAGVTCSNSAFGCAYGVDFNTGASGTCGSPTPANAANIELFADTYITGNSGANVCTGSDIGITSYVITRGATIYALCAGLSDASCMSVSQLDLTFLRPNPDATICANGSSNNCSNTYGKITLKASDGSLRTISIYQNGQITVNQ